VTSITISTTSTTSTTTATTTSTIVSDVIATSTPVAACTAAPTLTAHGLAFKQIFQGTGVTEDPNNPGTHGGNYPTKSFDGSLTCAQAVQACTNYNYGTLENGSFDVHYLITENSWLCTSYNGIQRDPSYFDQPNSDVGAVFGYSA
jgi:hypothetical protein